jgi:O-acetyl-ADP-ribose deacetylase (regulator of RNase III)
VIFPLFGSRYSGINPSDLAYDMIEASVEFLKQEKSSKLERIAFLAYTTADLELLRTALQRNGLTETGE